MAASASPLRSWKANHILKKSLRRPNSLSYMGTMENKLEINIMMMRIYFSCCRIIILTNCCGICLPDVMPLKKKPLVLGNHNIIIHIYQFFRSRAPISRRSVRQLFIGICDGFWVQGMIKSSKAEGKKKKMQILKKKC